MIIETAQKSIYKLNLDVGSDSNIIKSHNDKSKSINYESDSKRSN